MNSLEDMGGGGPVCKLEVVEGLLRHLCLVALLKVLDVDLAENIADLVVGVLEQQVSLHVLLLQQSQACLVFSCFHALVPFLLDTSLFQCFWDSSSTEFPEEGVGVEDFRFEEVELGG